MVFAAGVVVTRMVRPATWSNRFRLGNLQRITLFLRDDYIHVTSKS